MFLWACVYVSTGTSGGQKRSPGAGVIDVCEIPEWLGTQHGPLQERHVLWPLRCLQPHCCSLAFRVSEPVPFVNMHGSDSHMGRARQEDIDPVLKFLKSHSFIYSFIHWASNSGSCFFRFSCLLDCWCWGSNSGPHTCWASALLWSYMPHPKSVMRNSSVLRQGLVM